MKVHKIQQYNNQQITNNNRNQHPSFKGFADTTLRYFATNQAIGANVVDLSFTVMPRTVTDLIQRPDIVWETGRREGSGIAVDSSIGLFGAGIGALFARGLNKKYGLNANEIFSDPKTLNILAQNKSEQFKNNQNQVEYLKNTLKNVKAYNPSNINADKDGYIKISDKTIEEVAKYFDDSLNNKNMKFSTWTKDKTPAARSIIINKITEDTGAQAKYILNSADKKIQSETSLKSLLNDVYLVSNAFNKDNVKKAFKDQIAEGKGVSENAFIKKLLKFKKTRSAIGFGIAAMIGASVQPLNIYLTKLKTGSDGFVGVPGRSKDNSNSFKALKGVASVLFGSMILCTLNISPVEFLKSPSKFMQKMSFAGKVPTVNQLKGVYGITIISRIMAARDKDELREVLTKDTLGYISWLVMGDVVNKLVADSKNKDVMNYDNAYKNVKNPFVRAMHSSLKTRDEILISTFAKYGISSTKVDNKGNAVAKTFKELLNDLDKLAPEVQKATRKNLKTLNIAQVSGYLFSGLVLGLGIPNLNIYVTNTLDKKRKAQAEKLAKQNNNMKISA